MVRMEIHFLAMIQQTKISKSIRRQQIITYSSNDRYVLQSGFLVPLRQNACKFRNKLVNGPSLVTLTMGSCPFLLLNFIVIKQSHR